MTYLRTTIPVLTALLLAGCASLPNGTQFADRNQRADGYEEEMGPSAFRSGAVSVAQQNPSVPAGDSSATNDLWQQMRSGFTLNDANRPQVSRQITAYTRNPAQVEKVFRRAAPYMAFILAEVEQRGYPTSLALLPFVESGYDPFAYSHGRAAGLWQFIPGTGKQYGLEQDWWYDGRRDVVASTRAALDHLGALHEEFGGDWLLALAAYNAGGGTVQAAIERNRKAGKATDFWHLGLPRETMDYVPRLLAIREIVRHPGRYGVSLAPIEPTPAFTMVDVDGQIDLGIAAGLAGMETGELLLLNPGFNRLSTHPDGPHQLAIPVDKLGTFVDNLGNLPDEQRTRSTRHTVTQGETLSGIATRYKVTITALQQSNNIKGSLIKPGQDLLVSTATTAPNQLAILPQQQVGKKSPAAEIIHTVQGGENLWNIARKYAVSVKQLRESNKLANNDLIKPEQRLHIPASNTVLAGNKHIRTIHYTVKRGDSLSVIARKYAVSIEQLRRWNNLSKTKHLQPGQRLELHISVIDLAQN